MTRFGHHALRILLPLTLVVSLGCGGAAVDKPEAVVSPDESTLAESPPTETSAVDASSPMTRATLEAIVIRLSPVTEGGGGVLAAVWDDVPVLVVSDESMDRMRIVSPIVETFELTDRELAIMMEANYHATLDARYATSDGVLYAAFIHPLSSLEEAQIVSGLRQVSALVRNFRSTWSSDEMIFGSGGSVPESSPVF